MSAAINGSFNLADVRDLAAGTIAAADRGRQTTDDHLRRMEPDA